MLNWLNGDLHLYTLSNLQPISSRTKNVTQIFVPAGRTADFQPLDAAVNRAFKVAFQNKYHSWMLSENHAKTKPGNMRSTSKQQFVFFVSEAWNEVTKDCVLASFDGALWKYISSGEN